MKRLLLPVSILCCLAASSALAADWPHLRGPNFDGSVAASGVFEGEEIGLELSWAVPLGSGYSGIAVADGRAVTMFAEGDADRIAAFDVESGERVWSHRIADLQVGLDGADDGPLSSPVIAEGVVFALGAKGQMIALRMTDGKKIWSRQLDEDFGAVAPSFGFTTTPVVEEGVVILQNGGSDGRAIIGLDAKKGKLLWAYGDDSMRYQSPAPMNLAGRRQIVAVSNQAIVGLDAKKGKLLWRYEFEEGVRAGSANPSFAGEDRFVLFMSGEAAMFKLNAKGDEYKLEKLYGTQALGQTYAPPVYHDGHLYGYRSNILTCVDAATGERVWRSRPPGGDGLILVDDHLVLFGAQGQVVVAAATPRGYEEVAKIKALEGSALTWPAFASGRVFVRTLEHMAAVAVTHERASAESAVSASDHEFGRWLAGVRASDDPQQRVDEYFKKLNRTPIVEGEYLHFVYRGEAQEVGIAGTMLDSEQVLPMAHVERTDLFQRSFKLEPGVRWEYQFQIDFDRWVKDPNNPSAVPAVEGDDTLSEIATPGYVFDRHTGVTKEGGGRMDTLTVKSEILGYDKEVQVWIPASYDREQRAYPLIVVNDGAAWLDRGLLARSLDHLVGARVAPLVVAFVPASPQWWTEAGGSRMEDYVAMLADELVPALEEKYRLSEEPRSRVLLGTRFYAMSSAYGALRRADVFGQAVIHSVYLGMGKNDELDRLIQQHAGPAVRFYLDWNRYDDRNVDRAYDLARDSRQLAESLRNGGYALLGGEVLDSRGWGGLRNRTGQVLATLFPAE